MKISRSPFYKPVAYLLCVIAGVSIFLLPVFIPVEIWMCILFGAGAGILAGRSLLG